MGFSALTPTPRTSGFGEDVGEGWCGELAGAGLSARLSICEGLRVVWTAGVPDEEIEVRYAISRGVGEESDGLN